MLKVKVYNQSLPGMCGPAALRILFSYFQISKSEKELARLCKTTMRLGTHHKNLAAAIKKLGFKIKTGQWASKEKSWQNLNYWVNKKRLPVLVDWFSEIEGHCSVVVGLNKKFVRLADPEHPKIRKIPWDVFARVWFDFETDYIKKPADLYARWWVVAIPQSVGPQ